MSTRTNKSPDNTGRLNKRAIGLRVTAALIILLAVFPVTQRTAPTQAQGKEPAEPETMKIEMLNGFEVVAGEAIVQLERTGALRRQTYVDNMVSLVNPTEYRSLGPANLNMLHIRSKGVKTAELLDKLSRLSGVTRAEPNFVLRASLTPNDPRFGELYGLNNTGQTAGGQVGIPGADISAVQAWDVSTGSADIVVGVIDTGVDYNHPDLAANIWSAPAAFSVTVGGQTINCAAGTHGYNAITNTCNPMDDNNHGTHVSGTIGARGNNGTGVVGVNWTTSIMGLKFLSASGSGSTADAIECIQFAIQAKQRFGAGANVRVLNNSWGGGGFSQALLDAINAANSADMLFVAAAGNAGSNNDTVANYPSNYNASNVLAVASTTNRDARSSFSNFGATTVDLGAPGSAILSTVRNNGYASFNGTSMATPHAAGAAALVLSRCSLSTAQLKANLMNNVDLISALSGITVTGGRLNVDRSIRACSGGNPTPTPTPVPTPTPAPGDVFFDNFETNLGWTTNLSGTDTATTGQWQRANPETVTTTGTKQLGTTVSGVFDLVTGPLAGAAPGDHDVDGGVTSIASPLITLTGGTSYTLTFSYYMAHLNNSSTADFFRVRIISGSTIITIGEELGAANNDDAAWATSTLSLNQFAGQTIRILFEVADAGGASFVEAGVDDVRITRQ